MKNVASEFRNTNRFEAAKGNFNWVEGRGILGKFEREEKIGK